MSETAAQPEQEPASAPPVDVLDDLIGPSPLDQREAVMEEVAATRVEELRQDGMDIPPADAGEPEDGEPEPEPEAEEPEARQPLPDEPLYTVKVDGEERQVPLSEITASYQIQSAAQNRLDQASRIMRQAQERQQDVQGQAAAPAPAVEQQPSDGLDGIDWGGLAEKLQYGDKEAAAAALEQTVTQIVNAGGGAPSGPVATPEQIEARVFEKVEWTTALNRFGEGYQDILTDQKVAGIAGSIGRGLFQQAMQDSQINGTPRRPYWDILNEAGEKTREWLNEVRRQQDGGSEAAPNPNGQRPAVNLSPERGARKRAAPQPPTPRSAQPSVRTAGGASKAPKSEEARRREGIRDIMKGRGQA